MLKYTMEKLFFKSFAVGFPLPEGLNFTHIRAVMMLYFQGPCTMSRLSTLLILEKGSFTPIARKLINSDIIEKFRSEKDRRKYLLKLTEKGDSLAQEVGGAHINYINETLCRLPEEDIPEYFKLIRSLNEFNRKMTDTP